MTPYKFWLKSKTILFNLALLAVGSWTSIEAATGNLKDSISPVHYGIVMAVVGLVGVALRIVTTKPISTYKS